MDVVEWDALAPGINVDLDEAAADRVEWRRMLALLTSMLPREGERLVVIVSTCCIVL